MADSRGFIYVMQNPYMPELVKIGYSQDVEKRLDQFNRETSSPRGWFVYATLEVPFYAADKKIHHIITTLKEGARVDEKREFFKLEPEVACDILNDIGAFFGKEVDIRITENQERSVSKELGKSTLRQMEHAYIDSFLTYAFEEDAFKKRYHRRAPSKQGNYVVITPKGSNEFGYVVLRARSNDACVEWYMNDTEKKGYDKLYEAKDTIEKAFENYDLQWDRGEGALKSKVAIAIPIDYGNQNEKFDEIKTLIIGLYDSCFRRLSPE